MVARATFAITTGLEKIEAYQFVLRDKWTITYSAPGPAPATHTPVLSFVYPSIHSFIHSEY
jgi:hypothetical protein